MLTAHPHVTAPQHHQQTGAGGRRPQLAAATCLAAQGVGAAAAADRIYLRLQRQPMRALAAAALGLEEDLQQWGCICEQLKFMFAALAHQHVSALGAPYLLHLETVAFG